MVGQKIRSRGRGRARERNDKSILSKNSDFEGFDSSESDSLEPTSSLLSPARSTRLQSHLAAINSPKKQGEDIKKDQSTNGNSTSKEEIHNSCQVSVCQDVNVESSASDVLEDQESMANQCKIFDAAFDNPNLASEKTNEMSTNLSISTTAPPSSESHALPLEISVAPEELGELDDEDIEESSLSKNSIADAAFETNVSHGAEHQSMDQNKLIPPSPHEIIGTPNVGKKIVSNELSKNTTSNENSYIELVVANELSIKTSSNENPSVGKADVSNELLNNSTSSMNSSVGKDVDSNKLAKVNTIAYSVPHSMSIAQDPPIKIEQELPEQPAGTKAVQREKKVPKKFGEEFILVTVPKGVSPAQGQHECVLCLPGKPFQPKELLFHMRSLQHLKHMLELLDFESFMKHKQSNNAAVFVNRLSQMLGGNSIPKKVHVVRPEAAEETRSKLKLAIQELREQSRKVWREKQRSASEKTISAGPAAITTAATAVATATSVKSALKRPPVTRTCDSTLLAKRPALEQSSVEAVGTLTGTKRVLQLVQTNLELTTSPEHLSNTPILPSTKFFKKAHSTSSTYVTASTTQAAPTAAEKSCSKADSGFSRSLSSLTKSFKPSVFPVAEGLNSRILLQPPSLRGTIRSPPQSTKAPASGTGDQAKVTKHAKLPNIKAVSIKIDRVKEQIVSRGPEKDGSQQEKEPTKKVEEEPEVIVVEKRPSPPKEHTLIVLDEDEEAVGPNLSSYDSSNDWFADLVSPFPLQSGGTKRIASNRRFTELVPPFPLQTGITKKDFDHIVIMGDCQQLKSSRQWNYKKTTFFDVGNSLLASSAPKLEMMKSNLPRKTLWIFLADMGMVCGPVDVKKSICQNANCSQILTSPLPDYRFVSQISSSSPATELDSKTINNLVQLRIRAFTNALESFRRGVPRTNIIMLPLMPRKVHCTLGDIRHLPLHALYDKQPDILFTSGHAGNFLRAVRMLDLNWRILAGNFDAPRNLKALIRAFTNIPNEPFRVTLTIENSEKAYSHIYNWYKMAWSVVDTALGDTLTIPKEIPVTSHGKMSISQFLNSSEKALNLLRDPTPSSSQSDKLESPLSFSLEAPSSRLSLASTLAAQPILGQRGVEPPRLVMAPSVSSFDGVGGIQATPVNTTSTQAPKPLFPSAEMIIRMTHPATSNKMQKVPLEDQKRSTTPKEALSIKNRTDEPWVKKPAQLPVTAFPCLDISNGFPVFTSNIPKDVSVMLMKKVFLAIGELSDYRLETNQDDSTTCLSTTVYTKKECASSAIRVLAKLTVNNHQLSVFSSHVTPPVYEWDSNEVLIKYRIIRILTKASKTFFWDCKDSLTDKKAAERDSGSKRERSRSPIRGKSKSPVQWKTRSPARQRSISPSKNRSRSPVRRRTRSPVRRRTRSPVRRRTRSPVCRRTRSPVLRRTRSPVRRRTRSPVCKRTRSPVRRRTRSPVRRRTRSPIPRMTRSPVRRRTRSPIRRKSRSPARKRSKSPSSRSGVSPFSRRRTNGSPSFKRWSTDGRTSRASNGSERGTIQDSGDSVVAEMVSPLTAPAAGTGDPNTVIISSGGTSLTRLFIMEVHQLFNGFFTPTFKPRVGWLLQLGDSRHAQLLAQVMNNLRLVNTVVTARQNGTPEDREVRITDAEVEKHRARIQKCCKDYDNRALVLIQEQLNKSMDVYTFKIDPCTTQNCPRIRCLGYHDNKERRRNILQHWHRVEMCPTVLAGTVCPQYDLCRYSHTANEALLHPRLFLRDTCSRLTHDRRCTNFDFCTDAHPGTPDMLYHDTWQDLYVSGLENSYFFLSGAIRNLFKEKKSTPGFGHNTRVMFITPCPDVARYAHDLITDLAKKHEISVAPLNTLKGEIVIGSVAALFSHVMSVSHRCFGRLAALVLDDISGLLSPKHCKNIYNLVHKTSKEMKSSVANRVVVCSEVREYEVADAEKLLNTTFKVVSKEELAKLAPAKKNVGGANSSRWDPPVVAGRIRQGSARQGVEASRPPHEAYQSTFVDATHRPAYPSIAKPYDDFPQTSFSNQRAAPFEGSHTAYQGVATPAGDGHQESRNARPPAAPRHTAQSSLLAPSSQAGASDSPARLYISEKEMLLQKLEDKYKVYADTPARHPRCREFFDTFAALPNKDELNWKELWLNELDIMKTDEYQERMVQLVNKYKEMANNSLSPAESSGPYSAYNHLVLPRNDEGVRNHSEGGSTRRIGAMAQSSVWKAGSEETSNWRAGIPSVEIDPRASSWRFDAAQDMAQSQGGSWSAEANSTEIALRRSLDAIVASDGSDKQAQDAAEYGGTHRSSSLDGEPLQSDVDGRRLPSTGRATFTRPVTPPPPPIIPSTSSDFEPSNNKTNSSKPIFESTFTEYNPASPTSSPPPASDPPFDLEEVFSLLERLAPSLGVLTPAMASLVAVARRRRATSANALDLFADKEIVNVMSLALNNFKDQMQTASAQRYLMLKRVVGLGEELMQYSRQNFRRP